MSATLVSVVLLCMLTTVTFYWERRRHQLKRYRSAMLSYRLKRGRNRNLLKRLQMFALFQLSQDGHAANLARGRWRGKRFMAFDFHFQDMQAKRLTSGRHRFYACYLHFQRNTIVDFLLWPKSLGQVPTGERSQRKLAGTLEKDYQLWITAGATEQLKGTQLKGLAEFCNDVEWVLEARGGKILLAIPGRVSPEEIGSRIDLLRDLLAEESLQAGGLHTARL